MCLRCGARCVARQKPVIVGVRPGAARRADDAGQAGVWPAAYGLYNGRCMSSSPRHLLQTVRSLHGLARLALAWFVLSLGVAVASPWVSPQSIELICAGSGAIKVLIKTDDGAKEVPSHTLDCPLCAHVGAPPPVSHAHVPVVHPLVHALRPVPAAHIAARTAAPLPARGPPVFS